MLFSDRCHESFISSQENLAMSYYEDLARIKVDDAVQAGQKAQHYQRALHAKTDANSQLSLGNFYKWLALLVVIIKGG
jgi:hypothetical protein